jgi:hypothetical protein
MGELLAGLLKGLAKTLGKAFSKVLVKFMALFIALAIWIERLLSNEAPEVINRIVINLSLRFVSNTPEAREAAHEMTRSLGQAMLMDYVGALVVFFFCGITLVVFIGFPLIYKALSRHRLGIFISLNRAREDIAQNLQQCLEGEGARIYRIPFQEGATHQNIVMQATDGIKRCDSFVCLPGHAQSYVEHEVLAATAAEKPIAFLISESSGTLPNTADKRYPVFRLETTIREQFKPLIIFLGYVGADLRSTWKLCQRALFHPFMSVSVSATLFFGGSCFVTLWVYCLYDAFRKGHNLTAIVPDT